jgi:hypothetical protein
MSAAMKPLRDLVPGMRVGVDFLMIGLPDRPGQLFVWFKVCPCCGKAQPDPNNIRDDVALMTFEQRAAGVLIDYALRLRCGRRLNGQSARASELANKVGLACLGAHVALEELAGRKTPIALVVQEPAALAPGSRVAS